jgi:hypothetical protein
MPSFSWPAIVACIFTLVIVIIVLVVISVNNSIKNKLKTNIKLLFPFAMERQTVYGNFGKENDKERVSNSAKPKMRVPLQEIGNVTTMSKL